MPGTHKCTDCVGNQLSCAECCVQLHLRNPYHRIKRWNGEDFEGSDLGLLGLVIHVGHDGQKCPSYITAMAGRSHLETGKQPGDTEDEWENDPDESDMYGDDGRLDRIEGNFATGHVNRDPWGLDSSGTDKLVVVTSTGIFRRRIRWCRCPGAPAAHIQLLHFHLFSATIKRPSTAFTFDVLDHFHIDAMECKTAALNFYNKLRRLTNNAFPSGAPVSVWWLI